jgi:hypothetical protein
MSRIEELKKQNPIFNFNPIETMGRLFKKSKYVELALNCIKNKMKESPKEYDEIRHYTHNEYNISKEFIDELSDVEVYFLYTFIHSFFNRSNFESMSKFIELNEKNLIDEKDIIKIKTFEEMSLQISLSELKVIDKELEKQIVKLYEDDVWLVLKPLSWLSSKKYGANTKWCTTMEHDFDYFYKYAKNGVLIYVLNKQTGDKIGAFNSLVETELSFWDIKDKRRDSMELDLPENIFSLLKTELKSKKSNWNLLTEQEKLEQELHIMKRYNDSYKIQINGPTRDEPRINEQLGDGVVTEDGDITLPDIQTVNTRINLNAVAREIRIDLAQLQETLQNLD